jgi:four helix bundle protein
MNSDAMKERTKAFALRIIRLVDALPKTRKADVMGKQLLRCGTSVGANYRAACRARSPADFVAKMGIVEEEADETIYWIELLVESDLVRARRVADLLDEANQLVALVVASIRTARRKSTGRSTGRAHFVGNQNVGEKS